MQDDLISRQAVLDTIFELNAISFYEAQEDSKECYYEIRQAIENMLPVTNQKYGKWIVDLQTATEDYYVCSECGRRIHLLYPDTISNYPYCHCGAKMQESEEQE